jgi:bacillithiol system protein YtxJ
MNWINITQIADVEAIKQKSHETPCLIFKHSTTCPISAMAKSRVEKKWDFEEKTLIPYYLDLLSHRPVSAFIAEDLKVHHESPQAIIVINGEAIFDTSHLDITVDELHEALSYGGVKK